MSYEYTQPWVQRGDISIPGQCPARRPLGRWQRFKLRYWHRYTDREISDACRCQHYEGHQQFADTNPSQADHSDALDVQWPALRRSATQETK